MPARNRPRDSATAHTAIPAATQSCETTSALPAPIRSVSRPAGIEITKAPRKMSAGNAPTSKVDRWKVSRTYGASAPNPSVANVLVAIANSASTRPTRTGLISQFASKGPCYRLRRRGGRDERMQLLVLDDLGALERPLRVREPERHE